MRDGSFRGTTLIDPHKANPLIAPVTPVCGPNYCLCRVPPGGSGANFGCCFHREGLSLLPPPSLSVHHSVLFSVTAFQSLIIQRKRLPMKIP